ncbi:MAG: hypothetical protein KJZ86_05720 [Caldilineaceae bacterium]|nr:hypothetical protein [Caldilineaceae bacterium]HRJ40746.1 hypothetical protein [Caldilineaceae bacterium]
MKRVQMILEEWQHEWLSEEAQRQTTTMSALLRELITAAIEQRQAATLADDPLWGIIGIGVSPDDGVTSENLDTFLYRTDWTEREPAQFLAVAEDGPNHS